ncbi:MAG: YeiH family protein [Planctomycetota bacterium]|jgi:uncharacterized integral membrane protein (TIGR00698 family)
MDRPTIQAPDSQSIYANPDLARWLGSMEGVELPASATAEPAPLSSKLYDFFDNAGAYVPGVALAAALAFAGGAVASYLGVSLLNFERSPVSPILATILLGLIFRNTIGLPQIYEPGLRFCMRTLLRIGVALLGLRLSLAAASQIGLAALPVVAVTITSALLVVKWLGKLAGLNSRITALIAVGASICGVSAIVATAPAIRAKDDEISYAVTTTTLFGSLALLLYPPLAYFLFADPTQAGVFLGAAIHDTAQVAGAGLMYANQYDTPGALDAAVTTKLIRNVGLGVVIPVMAMRMRADNAAPSGNGSFAVRFLQCMPLFVIAFVVMVVVRTVGDMGAPEGRSFGLIERETWSGWISNASQISSLLLTTSMSAVGLGTSISQLRRLGTRPFWVGCLAATLVGAVAYGIIKILAMI